MTESLRGLLAAARATIARLDPHDAWVAARDRGALIVDTRADSPPDAIPGSLRVPLSVLQWRLAPDSEWRTAHVSGRDIELILICEHGESSSLAAASLVELGFTNVGDVVGGLEAWRAAGLPLTGPPPAPRGLPGMDGPVR